MDNIWSYFATCKLKLGYILYVKKILLTQSETQFMFIAHVL